MIETPHCSIVNHYIRPKQSLTGPYLLMKVFGSKRPVLDRYVREIITLDISLRWFRDAKSNHVSGPSGHRLERS